MIFHVCVDLEAPSLAHAEVVVENRLGHDEMYDGPDGEPFDYQFQRTSIAQAKR